MIGLVNEEVSQESPLGTSADPGLFYIFVDNHL